MTDGAILVTISTDKEYIPAFQRASAVITETGGITSHAAVVGLSLGIPVIVGVDNVFELLTDGLEVPSIQKLASFIQVNPRLCNFIKINIVYI